MLWCYYQIIANKLAPSCTLPCEFNANKKYNHTLTRMQSTHDTGNDNTQKLQGVMGHLSCQRGQVEIIFISNWFVDQNHPVMKEGRNWPPRENLLPQTPENDTQYSSGQWHTIQPENFSLDQDFISHCNIWLWKSVCWPHTHWGLKTSIIYLKVTCCSLFCCLV